MFPARFSPTNPEYAFKTWRLYGRSRNLAFWRLRKNVTGRQFFPSGAAALTYTADVRNKQKNEQRELGSEPMWSRFVGSVYERPKVIVPLSNDENKCAFVEFDEFPKKMEQRWEFHVT